MPTSLTDFPLKAPVKLRGSLENNIFIPARPEGEKMEKTLFDKTETLNDRFLAAIQCGDIAKIDAVAKEIENETKERKRGVK